MWLIQSTIKRVGFSLATFNSLPKFCRDAAVGYVHRLHESFSNECHCLDTPSIFKKCIEGNEPLFSS